MPVPACGNGRARGEHPRARRSPLKVGVHPRAGRSPLEGCVHPRARRSLLEGTFEWAALVSRGGHRQRGPCLVCALKRDAFSFGFLQVLSGISPVVLGDPQGCPRQVVTCGVYTGVQLVGRRQGRFAQMCGTWHRGIGCGRRCKAVGSAVAAVHRRLCPVGRRRSWRGQARVTSRAGANTRFKLFGNV
jgi:hypothetical protein